MLNNTLHIILHLGFHNPPPQQISFIFKYQRGTRDLVDELIMVGCHCKIESLTE